MTNAIVDQDRAEALYLTLDLIRCGDASDAVLDGLRVARLAGCWDGIADLAADPGYTTGNPFLTPLVLDIWQAQAFIEMTDDALRDAFLDMDGCRYGALALMDKREEQRDNAMHAVRLILGKHDEENLRLQVQRYGLVGHYAPVLAGASA